MRADHLIRKAHIRKNPGHTTGEALVFDFTDDAEDGALFDLAALSTIDDGHDCAAAFTAPLFTNEDEIWTWCAGLLAHSPTARQLWEEAAMQGWSVGFAALGNNGYCLNAQEKKLLIDQSGMSAAALGRSVYFRNALLVTLLRGLRDIWHESAPETDPVQYAPEEALMLERVRAADCDTVAILAGWELRGAGYSEIWRHLIGSTEGDMAIIFSRFLERDPAAFFSGAALAYAFRQWYADETRVNGCDHATLETLDDLLLDSGNDNPFGTELLAADFVESLSVLPDGRCYLANYGSAIKTDPFFAGLSDPINQTHLFHLIYDTEVTMVNNVPFRDGGLARRIFPDGITERRPRA